MIRFGHENLKVTDMDAAVRFYEEQLGLSVLKTMKNGQGKVMTWLGYDGDCTFFLELTEDTVVLGNNHIAFVTDTQAQLLEQHRALGIVDVEIPELGIHFIHDGDGNSVEIMSEDAVAKLRSGE